MDLAQELDEMIGPERPRLSLVAPAEPRPEPVAPAAPNPVAEHFERCRPWLEEALEGGLYDIEEVKARLARGAAQFWPGRDCAIVTEVTPYPRGVAIQCWLAGGDKAEILAMAPGIEAWGRLNGCTHALVEGRPGWDRELRGSGYERWSVTLSKVL